VALAVHGGDAEEVVVDDGVLKRDVRHVPHPTRPVPLRRRGLALVDLIAVERPDQLLRRGDWVECTRPIVLVYNLQA